MDEWSATREHVLRSKGWFHQDDLDEIFEAAWLKRLVRNITIGAALSQSSVIERLRGALTEVRQRVLDHVPSPHYGERMHNLNIAVICDDALEAL